LIGLFLAVGADIVDLVNDNVDVEGGLNEEATYFELSPEDEHNFQMRRRMNTYVAEEYHALHGLLWTTGHRSSWVELTSRKLVLRGNTRPDACRFFGLVHVNKMAGNFHVLSGKYDRILKIKKFFFGFFVKKWKSCISSFKIFNKELQEEMDA
jgi:hypothetical protein